MQSNNSSTQGNLNKSSTVGKAFQLLEKLAASKDPMTVASLTEITDFDKTTTYRFLMTLVDLGYVVRDEATRSFCLSYKIVSLGRNLLRENERTKMINEALKNLSEITQETIHYAILEGDETVVTQKVKGSYLVAVEFQVGDRSPLTYTSIGKAISAYQEDSFVQKIIDNGLVKKARNSIDEPAEFLEELKKIRKKGYAVDDHEYSDDMRCIAVPIFEHGGIVNAGISISGPDSRFTIERLKKLSIPMKEVSRNLSQKLGGIPWE